jgi:NADP-dependent 3-hydroxy acid dehydrogenase YdfG
MPLKLTCHTSNVQSKAGCDHLVEAIKAKEEKVHILVNNSGMSWGAPYDKYVDVRLCAASEVS